MTGDPGLPSASKAAREEPRGLQPDLPADAFAAHDHAACAHDTLARAEAVVSGQGARMTPVRRRVLEILLESHRAVGAYEVLERLSAEGFGHQPPVAYRALDFLVEKGLAHRIRRLNAFTACMHPGETHAPVFLICRSCDMLAEAPAEGVRTALAATAAAHGFVVERANIEALGLCPACRSGGEDGPDAQSGGQSDGRAGALPEAGSGTPSGGRPRGRSASAAAGRSAATGDAAGDAGT